MCKYCEEIDKEGPLFIDYHSKPNEAYISYDKTHNDFSLWDVDAPVCLVAITNCPWCGRKLEFVDPTPAPLPVDKIN